MGHNPLPPPPRRTLEDQKIHAERERYALGALTLEQFAERVDAIFAGRAEGVNDYQVFSQFRRPVMQDIRR